MSNPNINLSEFWPVMKEVLDSGGEFTFTPNGTSMLPLIRPGVDQVVLVNITEPPKAGDVIFYLRDNGQFVLHRVIKAKNGAYTMCGDNQFFLEKGIEDRHLLAKMKSFVRDGQVIDQSNEDYQKYIKNLPQRRAKKKIRNFLGRVKRKLTKKKTV